MNPPIDEGTNNSAEGAVDVPDEDIAESAVATECDIAEGSGDAEPADAAATHDEQQKSSVKRRRISVSIHTFVVGTVIVILTAAVGVVTWLYIGANTRLDDQARQADDGRHAEQIALDYAVNAAIMDYKDLGPWKQNLVKGTTPELKEKLTKAATAMEQILLPLEWASTAQPLAAKVRSHDNGVYVVDAFVSVMTKTSQAPESLQSTATYSITIDSNNEWQISDVGGIASVVADK